VYAVKNGLVALTADDAVELDHPTNQAFAEAQTLRREAKGLKPSPLARGDPPPPLRGTGRPVGSRKKKAPKPAPVKANPRPKPQAKVEPDPGAVPGTAQIALSEPISTRTPTPIPATAPAPDGLQVEEAPPAPREPMTATAIAYRDKTIAAKDLTLAKVEKERIAAQAARRELISSKMVAIVLGRLGAVLEEQFRAFGERNALAIVAAMETGSREGAIADLLDDEIGRGVTAFKTAVIHELAELDIG